jgi:hypothetical protein
LPPRPASSADADADAEVGRRREGKLRVGWDVGEQLWDVGAQDRTAAEPEEVCVPRRKCRAKLRGGGEPTCEEDKGRTEKDSDRTERMMRKIGEKTLARGGGARVCEKICESLIRCFVDWKCNALPGFS